MTNTKGQAPNFYDILGVPEDASGDVIKRRWRKLMMRLHPDRAGEDAEVLRGLYAMVNHVHHVLTQDRQNYDAHLASRRRGSPNPSPDAVPPDPSASGRPGGRFGGLARDALGWAKQSGVADAALDIGRDQIGAALDIGREKLDEAIKRATRSNPPPAP